LANLPSMKEILVQKYILVYDTTKVVWSTNYFIFFLLETLLTWCPMWLWREIEVGPVRTKKTRGWYTMTTWRSGGKRIHWVFWEASPVLF
jgi:hypothetical protein